jgi:flagellar biosynthesis/type III secretory pathway protein FliH
MVAPFGVLASTALLVYLTEPEADGFREFVRVGRESVDLGAVVYAAAAVSAERGVAVIFWALEQRKKYIAERIAHNERVTALWREEGREKGRTEGRAEGRAEAFAEIRAEIQAQANPDLEAIIDQVMKENGIDPTPPQNGASA